MKWNEIFTKAGKKLGFSDAEITAGLANMDGDVEDDVANKRLTSIFTADEARGNDAIFGEIKKKFKAETLNPIDTEIKTVEEALSAEQKAAYAALGDNTYEKVKFLAKVAKESLTKPSGDANYDTLKATYDNLTSALSTDYVKKSDHEELSNKLVESRKKYLHSELISSARKIIKNDVKKSSKHFTGNFISDVEELLSSGIGKEKVKGVFDYETGKIMRQDSPDQPLMIGTEVATIEAIAKLAADFGEYDKDYSAPPADPISIPGQDQNKERAETSEANRRNAERVAKMQ